jgi:hypothetical protein
MTESLFNKCQTSDSWRQNFKNFFSPTPLSEEEQAARTSKYEESKEMSKNKKELDKFIDKVEEQGIKVEDYSDSPEGLGDVVSNILAGLGIEESSIEKWLNIEECGCSKRKEFLNKIFPFRKKNASKEDPN